MKQRYTTISIFLLGIASGFSSSPLAAEKSAQEDASAASQFKSLKISHDPKAATAGEYTLDPHHTSVVATLSHMGLSNYTLRFNSVSGSFDFSPSSATGSHLLVTVDPSSVDTGDGKFDTKIASRFFEAGNYPTITFTAASAHVTAGTFHIDGVLDFHGVQKPLVLKVTYHGFTGLDGHPRMGFSGEAAFKRSDFGVAAWVPLEADAVSLIIETEFLLKNDKAS